MKNFTKITSMFIFCLLTVSSLYSQTIGFWRMDSTYEQDENVYVSDFTQGELREPYNMLLTTGYSYNGTDLSSPALTTGGLGVSGEALIFNESYALIRDIWKGYDSVIIDFWMNISELPSTSGAAISYIFRTGVWDLVIDSSDRLQWTARNSSGGSVGFVHQSLSGMENQWIHVVATFNSDISMSLSVNDVTQTTIASEMWWLRPSDHIQVGYLTGRSVDRAFKGMMDDVKILIGNLSYTKIYDDHEFNAFGLWHMDEIASKNGIDVVLDDDTNCKVPRDHDMVLVPSTIGGGIWPVIDSQERPQPVGADQGEFLNSIYFDGWADQYLQADTATNDMLGIDLTNVRYEAWYKLSQDAIDWTQSGGSWRYYIIEQSPVIVLDLARYFNSDGTTNFWQFVARFRVNNVDGSYKGEYVAYKRSYTDSWNLLHGWNHIAAEYEKGEVRLFINGVLEGVNTNPPETSYIRDTIGQQLRIGKSFWGWIDEVRVSKATPDVFDCGLWGYLSSDMNYDCYVNLGDLDILATDWLEEVLPPASSSIQQYPNLTAQGWPVTGNYNIPRATTVPTIDGNISSGEWNDARRIEMVYPDLVTLPNIGNLRPGGAAHASIPPDNPGDLSLYWFVKWDLNNLYLLGVVYDDIIIEESGKDEPQVLFNFQNDPNHTAYTEAFNWRVGHSGINTLGGPVPQNSLIAYSNTGDHYVIELKIAWSDIDLGSGYVPNIGDMHGFGFLCQDHDAGGSREHFMWDIPVNDINLVMVPANWNTITLVEIMPCGESGLSGGDINSDCNTNLDDFVSLFIDWLDCTDPGNISCIDVR